MDIVVETPIAETPRVVQIRGMFDLPRRRNQPAALGRAACLLDEKLWHVGLIVGPSGCGKTTIARHVSSGAARPRIRGPTSRDAWQRRQRRRRVSRATCRSRTSPALLSARSASRRRRPGCGPFTCSRPASNFASPWPGCLPSPGPAAGERRIVFDEFTSVVDRTVAQIGSAALAKPFGSAGTNSSP